MYSCSPTHPVWAASPLCLGWRKCVSSHCHHPQGFWRARSWCYRIDSAGVKAKANEVNHNHAQTSCKQAHTLHLQNSNKYLYMLRRNAIEVHASYSFRMVRQSQVTIIYIVLFTMQTVSKQLYSIKRGDSVPFSSGQSLNLGCSTVRLCRGLIWFLWSCPDGHLADESPL